VLIFFAHVAAHACGGFFCSNLEPVDQTAERIFFAHDPTTNEVEAHVQVFYEGPSEEFAWVIPVPRVPEVFVSTDQLFADLDDRTRPRIDLDEVKLNCLADPTYGYGGYGGGYGGSGGAYYYGGYSYDSGTYTEPVQVIETNEVGAYETVTLRAKTSEALVEWLDANGFDVPSEIEPLLAPYVADQSYFVAMRLGKDEPDGTIQPIGFRYQADSFSIPIQLTAVAAAPDMPVEVYVLAQARAVPQSYLHVQIDPIFLDWWRPSDPRYAETVSRAANEAGGHAFATDYADEAYLPNMGSYREETYDTDRIARQTDPIDAIFVTQSEFPPTPLLLALLEEHVPPPPGVSSTSFYNAPTAYPLPDDYTWDGVALAADLEERIVQPLDRIYHLFDDNTTLTRLTSSLDAAEMTVDPVFVLNHDMEQTVSHIFSAEEVFLCDGGYQDDAPRELRLPDGRVYELPSRDALSSMGLTEYEYLGQFRTHAAMVIEQTSGSNLPVTYVDHSTGNDTAAAMPSSRAESKGCACSSASSSGALAWVVLPLLAVVRRRR
jgi:uncharacterized protein (TIGR03382 family)